MRIEERLREISFQKKEYKDLGATWDLNKEAINKLLDYVVINYPNYSLHNSTHSETVIQNIERILGEDGIKMMTPTDLWMILHSAYLHDIGMVIRYDDFVTSLNSKDFSLFIDECKSSSDIDILQAANKISEYLKKVVKFNWDSYFELEKSISLVASSYFRRTHSDFSEDYILNAKEKWKLDLMHNDIIIERLLKTIASISKVHTKNFSEVLNLDKEENGYNNDYVHPRLVACLIRLGDALDIDNGRFINQSEDVIGLMPLSSEIHKEKHEAITHLLINDTTIEIIANCNKDRVYRELRNNIDYIRDEIDNINLNWNDIVVYDLKHFPKVNKTRICFDGDESLEDVQNLKYEISNRKAFELLEGSDIYQEKLVCLREIVQNADDALKIQLWEDVSNDIYKHVLTLTNNHFEIFPGDLNSIYDNYNINIEIKGTENKEAIVIITDNGTGISLEAIKKMCCVGDTQKRKDNVYNNMPIWLKPTAGFGVGLQSCFLMSNSFNVVSKSKMDNIAHEIIFETGRKNGYVSVKNNQEFKKRGTKVTIKVPNYNFSYSIGGYVYDKLRKIDPLKSNNIIIYKIIEYIFNECKNSFFNIFVDCDEINFHERINPIGFKDLKKEGNKYILVNENIGRFWYNSNYYEIQLTNSDNGFSKMSFKGKDIDNSINIKEYPGLSIYMDLYGFDTKKSLSLNRKKVTKEVISKIHQDLIEIVNEYLKRIDIKIISQEAIGRKDNKIKNLLILDIENEIRDKYNRNSLYELVNINTKIITKGKIDEEVKKLDIINKEIEEYYFIDDRYNESYKEKIEFLEKNLEQLSNEQYKIIWDKHLNTLLSYLWHDRIYLFNDNNFYICKLNLSKEVKEVDECTKRHITRMLIYDEMPGISINNDNEMRQAIPAMSQYATLATNILDLSFYGIPIISKNYIISPFTLEDKEIIKKYNNSHELIDYIFSKSDFSNLINYVYDNNVNKSKDALFKEKIAEDYKKLIEDYFVLIKDKENNN